MKYEIYWDDLNTDAKIRLNNLFHQNCDNIPLAIIETD